MVRIGYVPYDDSLMRPGDRRRFVRYCRARDLSFEIADPSEKYDLVVLTELADISVWKDYPHGKIVFDLIDAYLSIPRSNIRQALRGIAFYANGRHRRLGDYLSQLQAMCSRAAAVVCSTGQQAELIGRYCNNVRIILDIHDMVATRTKTDYAATTKLRLVWEGLPSNLPQLRVLPPDIRERVTVITAPDWNEKTLAQEIIKHDVAVIPIDLTDPFVTGKPENKLLLLWRMGMPVIASATPAYSRAMAHAACSVFACETKSQWYRALQLMEREVWRRDAGVAGKMVADQYGTEQMLQRWDHLFQSLGFDFGRQHEAACIQRFDVDWNNSGSLVGYR